MPSSFDHFFDISIILITEDMNGQFQHSTNMAVILLHMIDCDTQILLDSNVFCFGFDVSIDHDLLQNTRKIQAHTERYCSNMLYQLLVNVILGLDLLWFFLVVVVLVR